ncbi:MAG: VanZ family protein [Luteimonas sp.]
MKPLRHRGAWLALWLCGVTVLVVVCLLPSPDLPNLKVSDKLEHALAFALLSGSAVQLFERWRALLFVAFGLLALGIGIELAQAAFTTTRAMESADVVADGIGIVAGLLVALTPLRDLLLRIAGRA